MTHDDGLRSMAIGHLGDSDDIKTKVLDNNGQYHPSQLQEFDLIYFLCLDY